MRVVKLGTLSLRKCFDQWETSWRSRNRHVLNTPRYALPAASVLYIYGRNSLLIGQYYVEVSLWSVIQEIWANVHETRDSISLISYAGCLGLSPVILAKIHSKCASQPKITRNSLKPLFWGSRFKVVQGNRCWYPRKARQQCLLW